MTLKYNLTTTLNEIREHSPCTDGWQKLLAHLGKTKADDEPLDLLTVLDSNGLDDALWCLRCKSLDRLSRHFQARCAEHVLHIFERERPDDSRVRDQIAMLVNDTASDEDRAAARAAAWDAAWAAASAAASAAARDAAWDAARAAARAAARDAAWAAASAAARAAASAAAWDAAWDDQEAQLREMMKEQAQ